MKRNLSEYTFADLCWDAWCYVSIVGIWPRFIEPRLINTSRLTLKIKDLPKDLQGLRIIQFSDLHLHPRVSDGFLEKLKNKILSLKPDLIIFTGDFLCFSLARDLDRLSRFLGSFQATYGCYAILGNHDYNEFISINESGDYDILPSSVGSLSNILKRLWKKNKLSFKTTDKAKRVIPHPDLEKLLQNTPFKLLKNETVQVPIKDTYLNISGFEEYVTGHCQFESTKKNYNENYPGIILVHNPDAVPSLINFPGDIFLCGHTHGGQVNLPWLWKKFTLMENPSLKRGLVHFKNRWVYINRGVGSVIQFRWFAIPEILLLTLDNA